MHKAKHDLTTSEGGRGYIADLFRDKLERHDFSGYIGERLAADFACVLAAHIERQAVEMSKKDEAIELLNAEISAYELKARQRGGCVAVPRELLEHVIHARRELTRMDRAPLHIRQKLAQKLTDMIAQQGKVVGDE